MNGAYGWPRVWRELLARGVRAGKKCVRKLMKAHGLQARSAMGEPNAGKVNKTG
jgi:putative transposase